MSNANEKKNYLIDMDGVLVRGQQRIPGAAEFIARLREAFRKRELGADADQPHRIKYKPLAR